MIRKVIEFFKESYRLSPLAFYSELAEAILYVSASLILALTVLDPATEIFVPMFFIAACLGVISTVIRRAGFAIVLTGWAVVIYAYATLQLFII